MLGFSSLIAAFLKIVHSVCDTAKAVDAAQLGVNTFVAEPVAHRRSRFDRLKLETFGSQFVRQIAESLCALQIDARRG